MDKSIKKGIIIFSNVAISCGWLGVLADSILTKQPKGNSLGMLIWIAFPLLTAVLISIFMKESWRPLGLKLNLKGNLKWYLISFMIFPIIAVLVFAIGVAVKWVDISKFNFADFAPVFLGGFIASFIKNIFEELSWRGFLTERLIKLKCSDIMIYLITAIVWSSWHIPYYLVLLPVDAGANRGKLLFYGIVTIVCWIIMFTELYRITRSIWPCVILHAVINSLEVIYKYVSVAGGKDIFINYDSGIIALIICICIGMLMRKYRIKKEVISNI